MHMFLRRPVETHRQRVVGADPKASKLLTRRTREKTSMALRAVFDRTPYEAAKILSLRGLVRPPCFSVLKTCLLADQASPEALGLANADPRPRPGAAWFGPLVWLRPAGRARLNPGRHGPHKRRAGGENAGNRDG